MERIATVTRTTKETDIAITLNLDGTGKADLSTGIGFFDHMLNGFARHGLFDLSVTVDGDLEVDTDLGQITALIIPGRPRLLGLLGREPDRTIPWSAVRRFGEDIVLVDLPGQRGD